MTPRLYNKHAPVRIPEDAVYIGRPSKWGNPFVIGTSGTRGDVLTKHLEWVLDNPAFREQIVAELRGKDLVCFCAPAPCHGEILMEIANAPQETKSIDQSD